MGASTDPSVPGDPAWVPDRLAELGEELSALSQFVPAAATAIHIRRLLEELATVSEAAQQIGRQVPAWYRTNADDLYSRSGVYGSAPHDEINAQISAIEQAVRLLGEADMRLLHASRQAEDLELRSERQVDPDDPGPHVDEWWLIEEESFDAARAAILTAYETLEAAEWQAGRLAEEVDPNTELVIRRTTREGRGAEAVRIRGRALMDE